MICAAAANMPRTRRCIKLAPRADVCGVIVVVDVQDVRQRHRASNGRERELANGAAAAGDVHVQQAGSVGNPLPRDSEGRGHKIQCRNRNSPGSAAKEPRPARVDDAILRRLCPAWQGSQEIAHLPPNAAAVLQATGAKHENVDRGCLGRIVGIPGAPIA